MLRRYACLFTASGLDERLIQGLAEACFRFSPQVAVRSHEAIFLEVGGSASLFSEEELRSGLLELARKFGVAGARVAIADQVALALALARRGCRELRELPIEALSDYMSPFHAGTDGLPALEHALQALRKLGLTRLAELEKLPTHSFSSRFGKEISLAIHLLRDRSTPAWPAFVPAEVIREELSAEDADTLSACFNLSGILPLLSIQVDRVVERLQARCLRAAALRVDFTLDDRARIGWDIALAFPQGTSAALMRILQERVHAEIGQKRLSSPLVSSTLTVTETTVAGGGQQDFFDQRERQQEALGALVETLVAKLGKDRVFFASLLDRYLPEKAWERRPVPADARTLDAAPVFPERPSRMLPEPLAIQRNRDELVCSNLGKRWRIQLWKGPERLTEEWWSDSPRKDLQRDYYQILSPTGEKLWIFESSGELFLHGFFD